MHYLRTKTRPRHVLSCPHGAPHNVVLDFLFVGIPQRLTQRVINGSDGGLLEAGGTGRIVWIGLPVPDDSKVLLSVDWDEWIEIECGGLQCGGLDGEQHKVVKGTDCCGIEPELWVYMHATGNGTHFGPVGSAAPDIRSDYDRPRP